VRRPCAGRSGPRPPVRARAPMVGATGGSPLRPADAQPFSVPCSPPPVDRATPRS
jgi:hypothetical protein